MSGGTQLPNLEKIFRDDDESDFLPSGGSNLAAIFGMQPKVQDLRPSVKQAAHKKPSSGRNIPQTIPMSKVEVIIAKAVHAFKLHNGQYNPIGKLGMALTGNLLTKTYQIILYKTKQEHVSVVPVTPEFFYIIQPNNYSSYYDSNNENWSISFENTKSCTEFAREVGIASFLSRQSKIENVVYQDLTPMNKEKGANEGDKITVKYFVATEIVQPFKTDSISLQTMTVEISTDDNWERMLLGTNKGLKRILFLPPSKQISLGPGFPKDKTVMLEVQIMDICTQDKNSPQPKVSGKASIISRMAKMGQSMLPKISSSVTDSEDTEDDVPQRSPIHKKVETSDINLQKKHSIQETSQETSQNVHKVTKLKNEVPSIDSKPLVATSTYMPQWSSPQIRQNYVTVDGQMYSLQPQSITTQTIPTVIDPTLNMLLSETRMSNTEIRMGISKIGDNVQKLLDKFHVLELQNAATPTTDKTVDTTLKMLLAMNASQVAAKDNEVQNATTDKCALDEARNRINMLENEIKVLKESLEKNADEINTIKREKESVVQINDEMKRKIQELELSSTNVNHILEKTKDELTTAQKLNEQYRNDNAALESKISKLITECNTLGDAVIAAKQTGNDSKNKELKYIMNQTYHTLLDMFVDESYSTNYIKTTIGSTIKNITLQVLYEESEQVHKELELSKSAEIDSAETSSEQHENQSTINFDTLSHMTTSEKCTSESPKDSVTNIMSGIQDEPPPIPPVDADIDNDWLQL